MKFNWTPGKICISLALFIFAGLLEIGGGWLVWQTIRCLPAASLPATTTACAGEIACPARTRFTCA